MALAPGHGDLINVHQSRKDEPRPAGNLHGYPAYTKDSFIILTEPLGPRALLCPPEGVG